MLKGMVHEKGLPDNSVEEVLNMCQHSKDDIQGLIWKEHGVWVANFGEITQALAPEYSHGGRYFKCQVAFCPWCGEKLR